MSTGTHRATAYPDSQELQISGLPRWCPSQCSPLLSDALQAQSYLLPSSFLTIAQIYRYSLLIIRYVTSNIFAASNNTAQHFCP